MSYMRDADDIRLDTLHLSRYNLSGVELAYAENNTGSQTTVPVFSTYVAVPGATIVVPPTDGPVVVEYGAEMRVGTSGGGVGFLVLFQYTIDGTGTQLHQSALGYVAAQITAWSGTNEVKGRMRLAPSASERILGLRTTLIRDSGGVTLFIGNGILSGSPTFLAAMGA